MTSLDFQASTPGAKPFAKLIACLQVWADDEWPDVQTICMLAKLILRCNTTCKMCGCMHLRDQQISPSCLPVPSIITAARRWVQPTPSSTSRCHLRPVVQLSIPLEIETNQPPLMSLISPRRQRFRDFCSLLLNVVESGVLPCDALSPESGAMWAASRLGPTDPQVSPAFPGTGLSGY